MGAVLSEANVYGVTGAPMSPSSPPSRRPDTNVIAHCRQFLATKDVLAVQRCPSKLLAQSIGLLYQRMSRKRCPSTLNLFSFALLIRKSNQSGKRAERLRQLTNLVIIQARSDWHGQASESQAPKRGRRSFDCQGSCVVAQRRQICQVHQTGAFFLENSLIKLFC